MLVATLKELSLELNSIEITITDADLATLLSKYSPGADAPVSDLLVKIEADGVKASGKFQAGFLKGSFEALVSLRAEQQVVLATLADLKALGPVGGMFKGMIMSSVQKKLGDMPGVSGDDDAIRFDLTEFLAGRGVAATFQTLAISFAPGRLTLKLSGQLDCAM
jgi:hypothetical protein